MLATTRRGAAETASLGHVGHDEKPERAPGYAKSVPPKREWKASACSLEVNLKHHILLGGEAASRKRCSGELLRTHWCIASIAA